MRAQKKRRTRRKFTRAFKARAVRLVLEKSQTVARVARDLDLAGSVLSRWVSRAKIDRGLGSARTLSARVLRSGQLEGDAKRETSKNRLIRAFGCERRAAEWRHIFRVHEAAHAVAVLVLLRRALLSIEVKLEDEIPTDGEPGCVKYHPQPAPLRYVTAAKIVVALAAGKAQSHGFPTLSREIPIPMSGFCQVDWARAAWGARVFVDTDLGSFLKPFGDLAERLVRNLWGGIEAVSKELEHRDRMTGSEVEAIVSKAVAIQDARALFEELNRLVETLPPAREIEPT